MTLRTLLPLLALAAGALLGCGGQCRTFCERERECLASNLDVDSCTKTCEDHNDQDSSHAAKVKACSDCLNDNKACSDAFKNCTTLCFGLP